jgi:hypothetical protein
MIRLSGPRCLAMSVVGALFGWWASLDSVSTLTRYRGLSHEALLAELAEKNGGQLSTSIMGGLFVVVAIVVTVDVLTRFFKVLWNRIDPSVPTRPTSTPEPAA